MGQINYTTAKINQLLGNIIQANYLEGSAELSQYAYALGGYKGEISVSSLNGYDSSIAARAIAYIPVSCYFSTNANAQGVACMKGDNTSVLINGSNSGNYYVKILQLYI